MTALEIYDYPGGYDTYKQGERYAKNRLQALHILGFHGQVNSETSATTSALPTMTTPNWIRPIYLLIGVKHEGKQPQVEEGYAGDDGSSYHNEFDCIPAKTKTPYRTPAYLPPRTEFVTPPALASNPASPVLKPRSWLAPPGEEIYVDAYGRIKIQFRLGPGG